MFNSESMYDELFFNMKTMGSCLSAFNAWLNVRGSKTLKLRMEKSSKTAMSIAKYLQKHPKISKVFYPGLETHPCHEIALKNAALTTVSGGSSILEFELKEQQNNKKFLAGLKTITWATKLGGIETTILIKENGALQMSCGIEG